MIRVSCNLCKGTKITKIYSGQYLGAVDKLKTVTLAACRGCGLVFRNPMPSTGQMNNFYLTQSRNLQFSHRKNLRVDISRHEQVEFLAENLDFKSMKVLDIGCADGYFLSILKQKGWQTYGVEPSVEAAKVAKSKFKINVLVATYKKKDYPKGFFDTISIRHTLEHMSNPTAALRHINFNLKKNGYLFVEVPDLHKPKVKHPVDDYANFQHLYFFSKNTLSGLLRKTGFKIVKIQKVHDYSAIRLLAKKVAPSHIIFKTSDDQGLNVGYKKFLKTKNHFKKYSFLRKKFIKALCAETDKIIKYSSRRNSPIVIFGAGEHTRYMFELTNLDKAKISGVVDNDASLWGKQLLGYKIYSPSEIKHLDSRIVLISSYDYQNEIFNFLNKNLKNYKIFKLYNKTVSYNLRA